MPHSNGDNVLHVTPIKVQMNSGLKTFPFIQIHLHLNVELSAQC